MPDKFTLYKIYYDNCLVYLGRTKQPISARLWGHFSAKPMHKTINIEQVSRIEICNCKTEADMFLYEIYYINKLNPTLNRDDKAKDELTVSLPELNFTEYGPERMSLWKEKIAKKETERKLKKQKEKEEKERKREDRNQARNTMSKQDYLEWLDNNAG